MLSRNIYNHLIYNVTCIIKYWDRWRDAGVEFDLDRYQAAFTKLHKITSITKYRDFQYRLLLKKIPCNVELLQWQLHDMETCSFGCNSAETEEHLFFECKYVTKLLNWLRSALVEETQFQIDTCQRVILNDSGLPVHHVGNFVLLFIKQYVYRCKCSKTKPNLKALQSELSYIQKVEWFNSKVENRTSKHIQYWGPICPELLIDNMESHNA